MQIRRLLSGIILSSIVASGLLAISASSASATVADWNPQAPTCANTKDGGWWDFSSLADTLVCTPSWTRVFSATNESSTVYLDQTITRWTYNNGWHAQTESSVRYHATCGHVDIANYQWSNGDCVAVNQADTYWHSAYSCGEVAGIQVCGDIWPNADAPEFEVAPGTVYQVNKTGWWKSGGQWVPKTATFWMNDKGVVYNTQYS